MHEYNLGYRFQNGEVMGFKGNGITVHLAIDDVKNKLLFKLEQLEESYQQNRELYSAIGLNKEELEIITKDWKNS